MERGREREKERERGGREGGREGERERERERDSIASFRTPHNGITNPNCIIKFIIIMCCCAPLLYTEIVTPYSGKLLREKTFTNFMISQTPVKIFLHKILGIKYPFMYQFNKVFSTKCSPLTDP